jgi:hypothetical protein
MISRTMPSTRVRALRSDRAITLMDSGWAMTAVNPYYKETHRERERERVRKKENERVSVSKCMHMHA